MASLQELLASIMASDDPSKLLTHLQTHDEIFIQHLPQLDELLPSLSPAQHTLGLVIILHHKSAAVPLSDPTAVQLFIGQCRALLLEADPAQVQLVPAPFVALVRKFCAAVLETKNYVAALKPLLAAARALQPSPSHFTPLHMELFKFCVLSKCYYAAAPALQDELINVDKEATQLCPRDLLLHHYYGGMCLIGLGRMGAALEYFSLCFSSPTHALNAIQLEAYKKCLLCSLILRGETPPVPKYTAAALSRSIKSQLPAYTELAEACAKPGPATAAAVAELLAKHEAAYAHDKNLGLAKQAAASLTSRSIRTLTETYLTLALPRIAAHAGLPDAAAAEARLLGLIDRGEICATIDQPAGVVQFLDRPGAYDSHEAVLAMQTSLGSIVALNERLATMHSQLQVDPNYLSRVAQADRRAGAEGWQDDEMGVAK